MLDKSLNANLQERTQYIVRQVSDIFALHTRQWFIGLVVHGSAVKGGFIEGWSDIDFQLFLEDSALNDNGQLPLKLSLSIHKDLALIDPYPYQYIQTRVLTPSNTRYGGLVSKTYELVAGSLLLPELSNEQIYQRAKKDLDELNPEKIFPSEYLLEQGDGRLLKSVRAFCTAVWPTLYQLLTVQRNEEGVQIWGLTKAQAVEFLPMDTSLGRNIREFHSAVINYSSNKSSVEYALKVIVHGIDFLQNVKCWFNENKGANCL